MQSWGEQERAFTLPNTDVDDADGILSEFGDNRLIERFKGGLYGPDIIAHRCSDISHSLHIG